MGGTVLWLSGAKAVRPGRLRINGIGWHDEMPKMMVDRPRGTTDHLFMHFHAPVQAWLDGRLRDCPAHTLVVWAPGQRHTFGNRERSWSHSWLHCEGPAVREALAQARIPCDRPLVFRDAYLVERWLKPIMDELARASHPDGIVLESLLTIWVREIHRAVVGEPSAMPRRLRAVLRLMEGDLARAWSLREFAAAAHLSVSRFSDEFRRFIGESPMAYLLRLRLRHALHELRDRELSIAEVAARVGFQDAFYFSRQFKKHHGDSPLRYRQRLLGS